jgi:hypothetical protein
MYVERGNVELSVVSYTGTRLARKAALAEEVTGVEDGDDGPFADRFLTHI